MMIDELHGCGDALMPRGLDAAIHEAIAWASRLMVTWQDVLERHAELFADVKPGASIALAPGRRRGPT